MVGAWPGRLLGCSPRRTRSTQAPLPGIRQARLTDTRSARRLRRKTGKGNCRELSTRRNCSPPREKLHLISRAQCRAAQAGLASSLRRALCPLRAFPPWTWPRLVRGLFTPDALPSFFVQPVGFGDVPFLAIYEVPALPPLDLAHPQDGPERVHNRLRLVDRLRAIERDDCLA